MIAVDFFCGAGGFTRGLLNIGISVVLGIDRKELFRQTYEVNNSPTKFLSKDIRYLEADDLSAAMKGVPKKDVLFVGCAPCQPFTKQRRDYTEAEEGTLLLEFARIVGEIRPGQIVVENVPGITKVGGFSTYRRFRKTLKELKYEIAEGVIDAKDFGVPQTRRRYIMIAGLNIVPSLPSPTHGPSGLPYVTVRDAIAGYPALPAGATHLIVPNHTAAMLSPRNLQRIRQTNRNGGGRDKWPKDLILKCHSGDHGGHSDVYGRMWWDRPAPALTCRFRSLSNGRYGHPEQDRAISLREGAKLQTFDDSFVFYGQSREFLAEQIGNAVPVRLAEAIGKHILYLWNEAGRKATRDGAG
jgi:DNA (cytosine-5)-methyltransferase 1